MQSCICRQGGLLGLPKRPSTKIRQQRLSIKCCVRQELTEEGIEVGVLQAAEEVTIRRRPPTGYVSQQCGPLLFEVENADASSKPRNILEEIVWYKNSEVDEMRERRPVPNLMRIIANMPPPRNFKQKLLEASATSGRPGLIAEVKKASPSKGVIQPNFDPVRIAQSYELGGATCLSVLTDQKYFQGAFENLKKILQAGVQCPLLCKEFIIEAYQLFMARAHGADAVLLIAAVLPNKDLEYFMSATTNLGMQCLIEVHDEKELQRVSQLKDLNQHMVGINNRSLETFEVDFSNTERLLASPIGREILLRGVLVVGESGIYTKDDIQTLHRAGCRAVLVGESLVKQGDQAEAIAKLMS